ncbi:hypothetical protein [Xanthocytophaga flava]|uniref:hypothetical protein n=1 Tax=Xanthocytophaga flava TaxID=3048013 RepID=UPI0028D57CB0|nr:hypothetical protein [Xanthocytophaga flavus]MDJ1470859.1 hypothetical protein [Xanthocytophaga flavus]
MKYVISSVLYVLILSSCGQQNSNGKYFEGRIEYKISYIAYDNKVTEGMLAERNGTKMIYSFKDGNYMKEYYTREGDLIQKRIYNRADNQMYMITNDTVYTYSPARSSFKLTSIKQGQDDVAFDRVCHHYYMELTDSITHNKMKYEYYFDPTLKINPIWYAKYTEGDWNKVMDKVKCIAVKYTNETSVFKQIHTASKVEIERFDLSDFIIDPTLPKKHLN